MFAVRCVSVFSRQKNSSSLRLLCENSPNTADAKICASITETSRLIRSHILPILNEKDLEEKYILGSGPGGQCVNKSSNCVFLKHVPSGLFVRVQDSRSVSQNRQIARRRLQLLVDDKLHGADSINAKMNLLEHLRRERTKLKNERRREMRAAAKSQISADGQDQMDEIKK